MGQYELKHTITTTPTAAVTTRTTATAARTTTKQY